MEQNFTKKKNILIHYFVNKLDPKNTLWTAFKYQN